ncbi:lipopolysaccharide biosynthesis protein [Legionella adelaidensis]|uniref:lipopolysaccharide biosynthesis protein n=1 Tax=Legionella adelaidensis TaxID=45056 RepID=UPI001F21F622|nr:lipopolysaccharide biosynthesis protein [Legionella adelaidensis]
MGSIVATLVSFFTTFFLNHYLDKKEMGFYSYVFSIMTFAYPILSLSVWGGYGRFISLYQEKFLIQYVRRISWIATFIFILLIFLWLQNWYYSLFAFIILYQERLMLERAKVHISRYNFINITQKALFLTLVLFDYAHLTAEKAFLYLGISYFITTIFSYLLKNSANKELTADPVNKKIFLQFCLTTMLTLIINWVLTVSDQVVIKYYYGYEALAPYAVGYRIVTMLSLVSGIFLSYFPNVYFKEIANKECHEVLFLRKLFFIILIFATLTLLFCKNFIYIIFGARNYISESSYFFPLLMGEMLRTMGSVLMIFLTYKLKQTNILKTTSFIAVLNLVLNVIFVPKFGPLSAAYCTLACFFFYFILAFIVSYLPEKRYISELTLQPIKGENFANTP